MQSFHAKLLRCKAVYFLIKKCKSTCTIFIQRLYSLAPLHEPKAKLKIKQKRRAFARYALHLYGAFMQQHYLLA